MFCCSLLLTIYVSPLNGSFSGSLPKDHWKSGLNKIHCCYVIKLTIKKTLKSRTKREDQPFCGPSIGLVDSSACKWDMSLQMKTTNDFPLYSCIVTINSWLIWWSNINSREMVIFRRVSKSNKCHFNLSTKITMNPSYHEESILGEIFLF